MDGIDATSIATILDDVRDYYTAKIVQHGPQPRGVDWGSKDRQQERFKHLTANLTRGPFTVLDLGCGYGALWDYLHDEGKNFQYLGIDLSEEMINQAKSLHDHHPQCEFQVGAHPVGAFDYVLASGIFNVKMDALADQWEVHVQETIAKMFAASTRMCAFNLLTSYSDKQHMASHLYYADPGKMLDFCIRKLSPRVALLHHYGAWDFTVQVFKEIVT